MAERCRGRAQNFDRQIYRSLLLLLLLVEKSCDLVFILSILLLLLLLLTWGSGYDMFSDDMFSAPEMSMGNGFIVSSILHSNGATGIGPYLFSSVLSIISSYSPFSSE